jgi:hypothetical protein
MRALVLARRRQPLYTGPDGSTTIDGYGPAFQVWVADK